LGRATFVERVERLSELLFQYGFSKDEILEILLNKKPSKESKLYFILDSIYGHDISLRNAARVDVKIMAKINQILDNLNSSFSYKINYIILSDYDKSLIKSGILERLRLYAEIGQYSIYKLN
jgi:hypothetical protein